MRKKKEKNRATPINIVLTLLPSPSRMANDDSKCSCTKHLKGNICPKTTLIMTDNVT